MKLEVGKKYVCRDDESIKYVRIDAIRPEVELAATQVVGLAVYHGGAFITTFYDRFGSYAGDISEGPLDLVAEYVEPKLNLGPEYVGRRVRLANGDTSLITQCDQSLYPIECGRKHYTTEGKCIYNHGTCLDIIEILE